ncbi:hypothetical protein Glove_120g152 [Diversispora epigaea]|uniref:Uncharacterized protein n=1 Tax=Diversispora epigaea TaxID=1348612 RepID=A0A397J2C5_9GLOM|nr:hypothetical protein Glove_120g152 [Diversispora epigaea]
MLSRMLSSLASRYITQKLLESHAFHKFVGLTQNHVEKASPYIEIGTKRAVTFTNNLVENVKQKGKSLRQ